MTDSSPQSSAFTLYDLHSHTTASDGYLTPTQLVQRAVEMRVGVLAITDHDTTNGLAEAVAAIADLALPLQLVNGVEISTLWENHEIHIVGLGLDITHPALLQLLVEQTERRNLRAQEIGVRLAKARIPDAYAGAQQLAGMGGHQRAFCPFSGAAGHGRQHGAGVQEVSRQRENRLCSATVVYNRTSH